jgi:His-Xaa-Ser system protein HxsD
LKACYVLMDKIYIFLDSPRSKVIDVYLKAKQEMSRRQLEGLRDEFLSELVNAGVRKMVAHKNQKIVERIVGGAINAALVKPQGQLTEGIKNEDEDIQAIEKEIAALKKELEKETNEDFEDDPRNIKKRVH